jgi:hypothetical protein
MSKALIAAMCQNATFEFPGFGPVPGFRCEGLEAIRSWTANWSSLRNVDDPTVRNASFARHNLTTCDINLTGTNTATARTFFIVVTDIGSDHTGTYSDILVLQQSRWLFASRRIVLDWRSPDSIYPSIRRQ